MRVLLIDIDSLRPDHLGCYGYDRETSPTIDTIADSGVRFTQCYVSDSPCLPSRTALATCRHGIDTGVVTHFGDGQWYNNPGSGHDPDPDRPLSFQHLAQHGVRTASVSSFAQRHMAYHFSSAFQEAIQPTAETGLLAVEDATDVTAEATAWLDQHATDEDWLLHVNYWDVHHPYQGIEPFVDAIRDAPASAPDEEVIADQQGMIGPRTADCWPNPSEIDATWFDETYGEWPFPDRIETRADAMQIIDGYDASIRKVDAEVQTLLSALKQAGVREETVIIITGDHGEALGEHGIYAEHALPHPPCQRVPLIVSWPEVTDERAGEPVDAKIHQFDLLPTICELASVPIPSGWDARPFTDAFTTPSFSGRESVVCGHGIYTFGRALYRDDWVFTRLLHPGVFHHPGVFNDPALPHAGLELLHNIEEDPYLTTNLLEQRPEVADDLRQELNAWLTERTTVDWQSRQPAETRGSDPLAAMATHGPYLYVDPEALLAFYRENRTEEQRARLERSIETFK